MLRSRLWRRARPIGAAALLGVLVWRTGPGPALDAVQRIGPLALVAALTLTAASTVCCAWRWQLVARCLDVDLPLGRALAACYRAQFLNATLPGGVVGDVHRGVRHGHETGDVARGLRAVAWERTAGQLLPVPLTVGLLLVLPSPVRPAGSALVVVALVGVALVAALVLLATVPVLAASAAGRAVRTVRHDVRQLGRAGVLGRVLLASVVATAGHVAVFVVAARAAGATASPGLLLPLGLVVLAAAALPLNLAGWGPREGTAAWAFGAAGLGEAQGLAVAVVFGVLALVGTLPGAVVLTRASREAVPDSPAGGRW